jgi:hypothetical protein
MNHTYLETKQGLREFLFQELFVNHKIDPESVLVKRAIVKAEQLLTKAEVESVLGEFVRMDTKA